MRAATALLDGGASAVASSDGHKPEVAHLRALKPGTLVLVAPDFKRAAELASVREGNSLGLNWAFSVGPGIEAPPMK